MKDMEERYFYQYVKIGEEENFPDSEHIKLEGNTVTFKYDMIYVFPKNDYSNKEIMRKKDLISLGTPNSSQDIPEGEQFKIIECHLNMWYLIGLGNEKHICELIDSNDIKSSVGENSLKSYLGVKKKKIIRMGL
jgi:hypothetical protein